MSARRWLRSPGEPVSATTVLPPPWSRPASAAFSVIAADRRTASATPSAQVA
jgi:hypothetical protein